METVKDLERGGGTTSEGFTERGRLPTSKTVARRRGMLSKSR